VQGMERLKNSNDKARRQALARYIRRYENGPGQHRQQPTSQPDHNSKEDCCLPEGKENRNGFMRIGIWPPKLSSTTTGPHVRGRCCACSIWRG
jgi:hypothetical protein